MSHIRPHTKKVQICSTSPGYPVYCPKCNSTNVLIFYDPRFTPRLQTKWDNLIDEKRILPENRWNRIKDENRWNKSEKDQMSAPDICLTVWQICFAIRHSEDENQVQISSYRFWQTRTASKRAA